MRSALRSPGLPLANGIGSGSHSSLGVVLCGGIVSARIGVPCLPAKGLTGWSGGTGRRTRLKIWRPSWAWGFDSPLQHQLSVRIISKLQTRKASRTIGVPFTERFSPRSECGPRPRTPGKRRCCCRNGHCRTGKLSLLPPPVAPRGRWHPLTHRTPARASRPRAVRTGVPGPRVLCLFTTKSALVPLLRIRMLRDTCRAPAGAKISFLQSAAWVQSGFAIEGSVHAL